MIGIALDRLGVKFDGGVEILSLPGFPTSMMIKISLLGILLLIAVSMGETNILKRVLILVAIPDRANFVETTIGVLTM